jgi:hypothetical protein
VNYIASLSIAGVATVSTVSLASAHRSGLAGSSRFRDMHIGHLPGIVLMSITRPWLRPGATIGSRASYIPNCYCQDEIEATTFVREALND